VKTREWASVIDNIEPTALARYLADHGWSQRGKGFPGVETWARGKAGTKRSSAVLLPTDRSLVDFRPLLERAVAEIAEVEGRAAQDVIVDVTAPSSAVFRVGVEVEPDPAGGIPVNVADALMKTLLRATAAAAEEAARASGSPAAWQANAVRAYLDRVRFEHTEQGSYVMKALLPDRLMEGDGPLTTPSVPRLLMNDLQRLATVRIPSDDEPDAFREIWEWPFGLDVIDALAQLYKPSIDATVIEIELSQQDAKRPPAWEFRFERDALARLEHLREALPQRVAVALHEVRRLAPPRERHDEVAEKVVLEGEVVRLARPEISLETDIDGERRRVRVPRVPPELYVLAHEAHGRQTPVRVVGTLVLRGGQAFMRDVARIDLLGEHE
jgi:hypothetical protein